MHVVAKSCGEQANTVSTFAKDFISLFKNSDSGPFQIPRIDGQPFLFGHDLQPVVKAAEHNCAHRPHRVDGFPFTFAALQSRLDRFRYRKALWKREAYGRVDADTMIGSFFHCGNARSRSRDLHDHIGSQLVEFHDLGQDSCSIAVKSRVGLNREPSVTTALLFEDSP